MKELVFGFVLGGTLLVSGVSQAVQPDAIQMSTTVTRRVQHNAELIVIHLLLRNVGNNEIRFRDLHGFSIKVLDASGKDVSAEERDYRISDFSKIVGSATTGLVVDLQPAETREFVLGWRPRAGYEMQGEYSVVVCRWDLRVKSHVCSPSKMVDMSQ